MAQRRTWTAQEDQALKNLKESREVNKWSQISRLLEVQYGIFGRNGKQCRQRYHNHLDNQITHEKWSRQENQKLLELHFKEGNRWASISRSLPGRTDNCVKNHFYSQFRRAIRIVNDLMKRCLKKSYKPIKPNFINKIIQITQSDGKKPTMNGQFLDVARKLKQKILRYSLGLVDEEGLENDNQIHKIIQLLSEFNRYYRQKYTSKKLKRKSTSNDQENSQQDLHKNKESQSDKPKNQQLIQIQVQKIKPSVQQKICTSSQHIPEQILYEEQEKNLNFSFQTFGTDSLSFKGIGSSLQEYRQQSEKNSEPSLIEYSQSLNNYGNKNFFDIDQIYLNQEFYIPL